MAGTNVGTLDEWYAELVRRLSAMAPPDRAIARAVVLEATAPLGAVVAKMANPDATDAILALCDQLWAPRWSGEGNGLDRSRGARDSLTHVADALALLDPQDPLLEAAEPWFQALFHATGSDPDFSSEKIARDCDEIIYAIGFLLVPSSERPGVLSGAELERYGHLPEQQVLRAIFDQIVDQLVDVARGDADVNRAEILENVRAAARKAAETITSRLLVGFQR